ncbi:hypothetical protein BDDG_09334 [Blastomyces dermatitidis ATCC 18188]|uniref:C2H2-type domain-containing protein n=1 Tax=Ajellomyces dermatitidis (strain ATCC 18188 / CBS 674.68) TaxID=653446 RepID=F2TT26_AJEDA|nr:hypothetical protein BDDG_09334 [Blastomyces dermatitidis ATCC 18188]
MECIPCNRRFKNETALEKHIKYSPAHALKYDCSSCSRSFSSQNALGQHIRDSHPLRYTCNTCSRAFKTENGLEQHIEDCHPLKYDCNSCNRSFYSENALAQHIRDAPAHNPKGNNKSFKNKAAQKQRIQNPPADAHSYNQRWSMYPTHHEHVSSLLEEEYLHFDFHNDDNAEGCIREHDTNIMGRFTCHNDSCGTDGWSSRQIAITIRKYPGNKYNARVYHQRCRRCDSLSRPVLDESYAERVAYRIKKWDGIFMGAPPPYSFEKNGPHHNDLCEGCKDRHCNTLSSWNSFN